MNTFKLLILMPLLLVVAGCQSYNANVDETRAGLVPAPGTVVILNQSIDVHRGFSRSFIQYGRGVRQSELEYREPWCQFRLYEPPAALKTERTIKPDRFLVTRSYRQEENVAQGLPSLASNGPLLLPMFGDDRGRYDLSKIMRIKSSTQPQVIEFKCSVFNEPEWHNYVTIQQMRETLGEVVSLELAPAD